MSWTVYILECADSTLYTGITTDLPRRITEHEIGKGARYTNGRGPFRLVHQEFHINRAEASKREIIIKAMTRARKLALIQGVQKNKKELADLLLVSMDCKIIATEGVNNFV